MTARSGADDRHGLLSSVAAVRRRAAVLGVSRAALAGLAGLAAGPLASMAVLPWLPVPARPWGVLGCAALGFAAGIVCGAWELARARPRRSRAEAATLLAAGAPELRDLLVTGADLAGWGDRGADERGASAELAQAQVERAAWAAAALDGRGALPFAAVVPSLAAALAAALLVAGWAHWNPGGSYAAWASLLAPRPPAPVTVGNLRLVTQPPAYTALGAVTLEGVSGAVEGLRGTRVTLEGQLSDRVDTGRWEGSDGREVPLTVSGRGFRVTWILERAGTYTLSFRRGGRRVPCDFGPQPLILRPDERPRAELLAPSADLEVASNAEVEVRFGASDDFRVDRVELVLQGDAEVRVPVRIVPGKTVEGTARFLPLAYPKLGPGASLRVEAWDSDTVSGPKSGASRSVYLTFLDRKRLLGDIEGLAERLFEALLSHLADHLEAPTPSAADLARLRARASDLLKLLGALGARVRQGGEEGSLGAVTVLRMEEALVATLGPFASGGAGGADERAAIVAELERDVLFLDRLLRNLQMEDTLTLGDELSALQRSLFDELQSGKDPRELAGRVEQIQRLLEKMIQRLRRDAGEMPDSFANADAVKDMPANELQQQLDELRKALASGDRERARKAADKLLETLSRWMKALEDAADRSASEEASPVLRDLTRLEAEVQELMGDQEKVLQDTRQLADEASRKAAGPMKDALRSFAERQERRLAVIADLARRTEALAPRGGFHGGLPPTPPPGAPPGRPGGLFEASSRMNSALSEVRRALRADLGAVRGGAQSVQESFASLADEATRGAESGDGRREAADRYEQAAGREIQGLLEDLEALDRQRQAALGPREGQQLKGLRTEQERLGGRTENLVGELEELVRKTPLAGPGLPGKARGARSSMGEAGDRLGQGNPFGAVPPEGEALEGLSDLARELEGARRQMRQGQAGGRGPQLTRRPGGRGEQGRDVDRSHVDIPKEAEAQELKAFREEVLKAMRRREYPKNYEDEVERYYERLIR
ncbi:MAG: DUF4175 family protein [Deltaproteobacteria bacterium]|nr:DUF4175 family protein [Deltaproteobacteria bacterium]